MTSILVTTRSGIVVEVAADGDRSLMEVIRDGGIDELLATCGGSCSCATCHVYIDAEHFDRLPPPEPQEDDMLGCAEQRRPTSRLSCQLRCTAALDGLRVEVAPEE